MAEEPRPRRPCRRRGRTWARDLDDQAAHTEMKNVATSSLLAGREEGREHEGTDGGARNKNNMVGRESEAVSMNAGLLALGWSILP